MSVEERHFLRYPKTLHIEGSGVPGSSGERVSFADLKGKHLVIEEKLDGANAAIGFTDGRMTIQSRGHYMTGGQRERHFDLLKRWAAAHRDALYRVLGDSLLMYGEWMFAKHTVFYDALPHYFMEFDIREKALPDNFYCTETRQHILKGAPVVSVPVLAFGPDWTLEQLKALLGRSVYKTEKWRDNLRLQHGRTGLHVRPWETDQSDLAEGLYIKAEEGGRVTGRYKLVREGFLKVAIDSGTHWINRPILPNMLAADADIWKTA